MAYAKLASITCWICSEPYQPTRPENKVHAKCERARRKQAAAEKKWAKQATRILVTAGAAAYKDAPHLFEPAKIKFSGLDGRTHYAGDGHDHFIGSISAPGSEPLKILVIPDTQTKPGVPLEHLTWLGLYAAAKKPDVVVHLGDHWDLPSLSSYDAGKKSFEGRRYTDDIAAGNHALDLFDNELAKVPSYNPRKVFLLGNHEQRCERAVEADRKLEGLIGYHDFNLKQNGWEVHDFLEVVKIAGIEFSHYFIGGSMGRPVSSANVLLNQRQGSAIQGHNQQFQIASHPRTLAMAIFAGAFYQHTENYLTPQGQGHRRHVLVLHEAQDGLFDLMTVSLNFLRKRFS